MTMVDKINKIMNDMGALSKEIQNEDLLLLDKGQLQQLRDKSKGFAGDVQERIYDMMDAEAK